MSLFLPANKDGVIFQNGVRQFGGSSKPLRVTDSQSQGHASCRYADRLHVTLSSASLGLWFPFLSGVHRQGYLLSHWIPVHSPPSSHLLMVSQHGTSQTQNLLSFTQNFFCSIFLNNCSYSANLRNLFCLKC